MEGEIRCAVLTISDRASRGERQDLSGPVLEAALREQGWAVIRRAVIPDDRPGVASTLTDWADRGDLDVILTSGGTGFAARDQAPEATASVVDRLAPGLSEAIRAAGLAQTPHAMLARGLAGIRGRTLIVNLAGSPRAAREGLAVILPALPHAVELLRGDPSAETGHRRREPPSHA